MKSKRNKISNLLKLGILLFGISLLLYNCQKEELSGGVNNNPIKTVSLKEAKNHFLNFQENQPKAKGSNPLIITPKWETLSQKSLFYTDALLTKVDITINREGNFTTKILYIEVNGEMKNVIYTLYADELNADGTLKIARVYLNELNGDYIDGYGFRNGLMTARFVYKKKINTASSKNSKTIIKQLQSKMFAYEYPTTFWANDDNNEGPGDAGGGCTGTCLDEVELPYRYTYNHTQLTTDGIWGPNGSPVNEYVENEDSTNDHTGGGGIDISTLEDVVTAIVIDPVKTCNKGYELVNGECVAKCVEGEIRVNEDCVIDTETPCTEEGFVRNDKGICVQEKKPCVGDPVRNIQIVSSGKSGRTGGTFGCTRTDPTTSCGGIKGKKNHNGLDIKATINTSTFSMYDGTVSSVRDTFSPGQYKKKSYGNYIQVTTVVDGKTVFIKYNHLNKVHVKKGDKIKAGDIIGLNGNTGNAADKKVTPHIHLQIFDVNWEGVDPKTYLNTKFDNNQNPIPNIKC